MIIHIPLNQLQTTHARIQSGGGGGGVGTLPIKNKVVIHVGFSLKILVRSLPREAIGPFLVNLLLKGGLHGPL